MKKIYISGKIGDTPDPNIKRKFAHAAGQLTAMGYLPINPFNNGLSGTDPWIEHLIVDLRMLKACDGIYMLPDWYLSPGARIEHEFAFSIFPRSAIIYQPDEIAFKPEKINSIVRCKR